MQYSKYSLGWKEFVGDHSDEKWREYCRNSHRAICSAHLNSGRVQNFIQVSSHRHIPCSPDKKLEKHHSRKLDANSWFHAMSLISKIRRGTVFVVCIHFVAQYR